MVHRPPPDTDGLGADLVAARAAGVPWKVLQARYGLGRTRLWMVWRAAANAVRGAGGKKNVHEHIEAGLELTGPPGLER